MKGFFSVVLIIIIIITSIVLITNTTEIKINTHFFNDYSNQINNLQNYEFTLNQKAWDYNWEEKDENAVKNDFNLSSIFIIEKTFNQIFCETKNWEINILSDTKTINHDINCTILEKIGDKEHYLNYSKRVIVKSKP